ncbi:MAG TPA: TRAP transporter substrate-binding protein DctP [Desulfatiglandales bacterium]|nr:TRAP transporter substrate-binding protein DctP [Desulfatiglandales bacterium]
MKRVSSILVFAVIGFSIVFLFSSFAMAAKQKPIKIVFSNYMAESFWACDVDKWFLTEVEKRTNGKVRFDRYFGSALTKGMETLPALRSGAVDMVTFAPGYFPDELPLAGLFNVIRIPRTIESVAKNGYQMYWKEHEISKAFEEEAKRQNFKYMYHYSTEFLHLTKKPFTHLSDFKGVKMRSVGLYEPRHLARWGALAVNVLVAEWYEALSRGTIDGIGIPRNNIVTYKLHEAAKNISFRDGCVLCLSTGINLDTWKKLPKDVRDVMEGMREEHLRYNVEYNHKTWNENIRVLEETGCKFADVDPKEQEILWNDWIRVAIDFWLPFVEKKGVGAKGEMVLNRWLQLNTAKGLEYWRQEFTK